ncbi:dephospho-CoA kinase [Pseudomarimonas salicorniae]|uniref:Dephospho-CoA kinase n=1 Tax=Pseudomarimonas salicorniae TaxID=2933270 RepID=A0ABT0GFM2_9GAMM|nr:dephospho-CoA kinase [Lysobacter sp. CAU 1642]MCK7593341.1 dephospho-CoA kinase [Lysobacter sp. CAU 1642]
MSTPVMAVTGGIASGKSAACAAFEGLGRRVIDADLVSRELVEPGQPALSAITSRFGAGMLDADGRLDRRRLRQHVFSNEAARRDLEAILHPRIRETLRQRAEASSGPYALVAVPLLLETGAYGWVRRVLLVDVPEPLQVERVMQRDDIGRAEAQAILSAQAPRRARWAIADDVLLNDGSLADLGHAVERLDRRWRKQLA